MSHLYHTLAKVYEAMYQTFMDYEAEYAFYAPLVRKHQAQSLLELGCGTGNMAGLFRQDGIDYLGVDLSEEMLALAREKHPTNSFHCADISEFVVAMPKDVILMIGRTISYLTTTKSVLSCFEASFSNLVNGGVLIFDFIDATQFIPTLDPKKTIEHKASFAGRHYLRKSRWAINLKEGFQFDWVAEYFEFQKEGKQQLGKDFSTIRTFTEAELRILLQLAGFRILEVIEKASYAFPTKVMVARKDELGWRTPTPA